MHRNLIIYIALLVFFTSCREQIAIKAFLDKYENEDFSEFNNTTVFFRGVDENHNPIIFIDPPCELNLDSLGVYVVILDKNASEILSSDWTLSRYRSVDANIDTLRLQHLVKKFVQYEIPRLSVDTEGNVFVYFKDVETLSLVHIVNDSLFQTNTYGNLQYLYNRWYKYNRKE